MFKLCVHKLITKLLKNMNFYKMLKSKRQFDPKSNKKSIEKIEISLPKSLT